MAKLYDLKLELVIDDGYGFLEQLQEMIADSNPMVDFFSFRLEKPGEKVPSEKH